MSRQVIGQVDLADGAGSILLYDWMAKEVKDSRNLLRVDAAGNILWKASPPAGTPDCFTAMQWDGHALTANTWSCYKVGINPANGDVTVLAFTK